MRWNASLAIGLAGLVALAGSMASAREGESVGAPPGLVPSGVSVVAERRPFTPTLTLPGEIRSTRRHEVVSHCYYWSSVVWMASEGDAVSEGQLVASVMNGNVDYWILEFDWRIGRRRASLEVMRARSELAQVEGEHKVRAAEIERQLAELRLGMLERGPAVEEVQVAAIARDQCRLEAQAAAKALERTRQLAEQQDASAETLRQAEWEHRLARAQLREAEADLRVLTGGTTEPERQAARTEANLAGLRVQAVRASEAAAQERRKAELAQAEEANKQIVLTRDRLLRARATHERRAPASGLVLWPEIHKGGKARPGVDNLGKVPIITVLDPSSSSFVAQATEEQVAVLGVGQDVRVELHSLPGRALAGKVAAVGVIGEDLSSKHAFGGEELRREAGVRVYDVVIDLDRTEVAGFPQGTSGTVVIEAGEPVNTVVVPRACTQERGGSRWALAWRDGGWLPCRVAVASEDADNVAVASGLAAGDRVSILSE